MTMFLNDEKEQLKSGKLLFTLCGIASCIIGVLNLSYAGFLAHDFYFNEGKSFPDVWFGQVAGLFFIPLLFLIIPAIGNGTGLILGGIGLFQTNRKRIFAVLGMIMNGIIPACFLIGFVLILVQSQ